MVSLVWYDKVDTYRLKYFQKFTRPRNAVSCRPVGDSRSSLLHRFTQYELKGGGYSPRKSFERQVYTRHVSDRGSSSNATHVQSAADRPSVRRPFANVYASFRWIRSRILSGPADHSCIACFTHIDCMHCSQQETEPTVAALDSVITGYNTAAGHQSTLMFSTIHYDQAILVTMTLTDRM